MEPFLYSISLRIDINAVLSTSATGAVRAVFAGELAQPPSRLAATRITAVASEPVSISESLLFITVSRHLMFESLSQLLRRELQHPVGRGNRLGTHFVRALRL